MISSRATEMPTRIEISAETRARPIQSAEISQTFSMCGPLAIAGPGAGNTQNASAQSRSNARSELILAGAIRTRTHLAAGDQTSPTARIAAGVISPKGSFGGTPSP